MDLAVMCMSSVSRSKFGSNSDFLLPSNSPMRKAPWKRLEATAHSSLWSVLLAFQPRSRLFNRDMISFVMGFLTLFFLSFSVLSLFWMPFKTSLTTSLLMFGAGRPLAI